MATNFEKLRRLLEELFQLDQADLDFGIYRIMNQKRDEIIEFLDKKLLPQVQEAFSQYKSADKAEIKKQLDEAITEASKHFDDPEESKQVKELREKYDDSAVDVVALENEVFSHLYNFFRRYYHEGDFISQRRYKEGVYAIPYEGEEVKLHWANRDQYYIKSSEYFRDYTFTMPSGKRVRVHLVSASAEQDNKKEVSGKERRFIICDKNPVYEQDGELYIRFEYRSDSLKKKQDALNKDAIEKVLKSKGFDDWVLELGKLAPTAQNPNRTVLEKHLKSYTAKNSFDYFIHKDLGGFLRRELDFFLKSEVMHLDDIEDDSAPRVEQYLSKLRVMRRIATKIIQFLEQLEGFQKRIWLKKKFVVETNYCLTLDKVPDELLQVVAANDAQHEEWVRLFAIDQIDKDSQAHPYSSPLSVEFLRENASLLLDTRFFAEDFCAALLRSIDDLDASCVGTLVRSENFQALSLMQRRLRQQVKCVYIDPPYNTDVSAIPYKNNYRHSSWGTMMHDRVRLLRPLLTKDGVLFVSIDKNERSILQYALDSAFGNDNHIEELIWIQNTNDGRSPTYSTNHEYVEVYANDAASVEADPRIFREPKPGFAEVSDLLRRLNKSYPSVAAIEGAVGKLYQEHLDNYKQDVLEQDLDWETEKRNNPWKGIYAYKSAEYRTPDGVLVPEDQAAEQNAHIWLYQEDNWTIMSSESKQSDTTRNPEHPNYRYYDMLHPKTGKPCKRPARGWKGTKSIDPEHPDRNSFESLCADHRIAFGEDENKVPRQKRFLHEVATNVCKSVFADYADGERQTTALFGRSGVFLAPKHTGFVRRFLKQTVDAGDTIIDCFGGSGSTAHAVIESNREEGLNAKFVLVEVNEYFETVLKPRVLKALYAETWKGGKPVSTPSASCILKYIRLESYEDALNNLEMIRTDKQRQLLDEEESVQEQYMLSYLLDVESRGSQSLLNVDGFRNPDDYKLKVEKDSETQLVRVDLVETFNWLLGLTVRHIDVIRGVRVVEGTNPEGDRVLILWRNLDVTDNDALNKWFAKQDYNTKEQVYDIFYVNGDNNIENLRRPDQTWKVRLIEEEFQRLMFDVEDV